MGPPATAEFSIGEAWKALGFFAISLALVGGMITGFFNGTRARIGWMLLGTVLVVDLYRANTPWVKYYDWVTRYQSNPVLDLLKDKPWEQRVTAFLDPHRQGPLVGGESALSWTYLQKEWLENQFQYFNIQSLDISQMPRVPELETAYFAALGLMENQSNLPLVGRLWQLTNTRYILGSKEVVDQLNGMVDPVQKRIRLKMPFGLGLKPGVTPPTLQPPPPTWCNYSRPPPPKRDPLPYSSSPVHYRVRSSTPIGRLASTTLKCCSDCGRWSLIRPDKFSCRKRSAEGHPPPVRLPRRPPSWPMLPSTSQ